MNKFILLSLFLPFFYNSVFSQSANTKEALTLDDMIEIACKNSPDAIRAKHQFKANFWQFKSYKSSLKPTVSLNSNLPSLNRSLDKVVQPDGRESFIYRNVMNTNADLSVSQNLFFTGGTISLSSGLARIDLFGKDRSIQYMATPLSVSLNQPLNGFNEFKWQRKIEPLTYEKNKKEYIIAMENIAVSAIEMFFSLASAQLNYDISKINFENADTLFKLGKGRYSIGIIAEDELLQLELSLVNSKIDLARNDLDLKYQKSKLLNFLGFDINKNVELIISDTVPNITLDFDQVFQLALQNNPSVIAQKLSLLNAERDLAQKKSNTGFQSSLMMQYSLNQSANDLQTVYKNPQDGQVIQLGISIPILDWGKSKGEMKMARSNLELTKLDIEQTKFNFEQEIHNSVMQFNMQQELFTVACKADTIAQMRYNISKKRYYINKISILDLNSALTQKDQAKRNYLENYKSYWVYYYNIRKYTLFDFLKNEPLGADFDKIIEE